MVQLDVIAPADRARTGRRILRQGDAGPASGSPVHLLERLSGLLVWITALALAPCALAVFVLVPFAFDTLHLADTLFLADLGWRVLHGLTPALDFGHFYGGVIAQYVALAFRIFGVDAKSIDYAFVLMLFTALGLAAVICRGRLPRTGTLALMCLVAACLLSRVPMEQLTAVQEPVAAHSFVYNRFAIALALPACLFVLVRSAGPTEIVGAILCGAVAFTLILIKPTFVTFAPFYLLALALTRRWTALAWSVIGFIGAMLILDFGMSRSLAAFDYAVASTASKTSIHGMLAKCVAVFLVHPLALLLVLAALAVVARAGAPRIVGSMAAVACLTAGFAGMVATMGWQGDIGQQALPFMAVLLLGLTQTIRPAGRAPGARDDAALVHSFALLSVLAFSVPVLSQTILSGGFALTRAGVIEITDTPIDGYLAWSEDFTTADGQMIRADTPWPDRVDAAIADLEAGQAANVGVQYVQLIEGIRLLQQFDDVSGRGIAGDFSAFAYALGARPVAGFPPWVEHSAPELAPGRPLPDEIDTVILRRQGAHLTTDRLRQNMAEDFVACRSSAMWTAYIRTGSGVEQCTDAP